MFGSVFLYVYETVGELKKADHLALFKAMKQDLLLFKRIKFKR